MDNKVKQEVDNLEWNTYHACDFSELFGKIIISIEGATKESKAIAFVCSDGSKYYMYHEQDCCELVTLEDFDNDAQSLIGGDIIRIEECISNANDEEFNPLNDYDDSYTWTFYTIITSKGIMKLRWYGTSNGWYSEDVTLSITLPFNSIILN
jgi:hypothetical protein